MSTYKVIQDIEAEDKLVGPLSLRQFIYAVIVAVSGFLAFKAAMVAWWLALLFLPHMVLFAVLAAPFGRDQPSEVWLLAKIRFFLKPRRRIWDQSGVKELVAVTAPKAIERHLTKDLTQTEVKSRLQALANTIDSRGWAVKNVNVNLFAQPSYVFGQGDSDRLIDPGMMPQEVPNYDVQAVDDILDEQNNPTAQFLDQMIHASSQNHRQQIEAQMQHGGQSQQPADYWFMNSNAGQQPAAPTGYTTFDHNPLVAPGAQTQPVGSSSAPKDPGEQQLLDKIKADKAKPNPTHTHLRRIDPEGAKKSHKKGAKKSEESSVTPQPDPTILNLANNNDLNVATLGRQANKARKNPPDNEVIISLR